ncbi:hypothetical protein HC031_22670 [Planosporangium thailandense]|uniref:Uncharacterized protein n=1 Tax=Planosporangium thailandense TaxID=765197 RepID=A0ABX0Y525_9ACTN|nr:VenA family class IV lanthipeptide [Planosporangium thailandense]NJC72500.1 hypothetical protein [Planosporangium thailandense]
MQLDSFDLVASLQALPETDPIEIDGVQFNGGGGGGSETCAAVCIGLLTINIANTLCIGITCA